MCSATHGVTVCFDAFLYLNLNFKFEASRGAGAQIVTVKSILWVRSPFEEIKYLLTCKFSFLRSGVEVKRGVEFCHSTRNASRTRRKVRNGVS